MHFVTLGCQDAIFRVGVVTVIFILIATV